MNQGRSMKMRKTMTINATTQPPPLVKTKGKKMMVHSPDWTDRIEARKTRKNPAKIRSVPMVIRFVRCSKGVPRRRSLLAHWRQSLFSGT